LSSVNANCVSIWMVIVLAGASFTPVTQASEAPDYASLLQHLDAERAWSTVDELAGDTYAGRRSGTQGADLASEYIADYFGSIGLKPAGSSGSYRTKLTVPLWELAQMPSLSLVDESDTVLQSYQYREDFNVLPGSGEGDYSAEVVFGGYGISAKDLGYDDYAGISARGKIVLVIVGTPPSDKLKEGNYGLSYAKADNALNHGVVGLILVDSPAAPTAKHVQRARCTCCWTIYRKLMILGGSIQFADTLLKDSGLTLSAIQQTINRDIKPQSLALGKRLHVSASVSFTERADTYNVLGLIPGSDPAASKKVVIIGAHYDHWGKDVDGSIFRGADDNASGVAVMMEIARLLSTRARPKWSVMLAAWTGEEEGLYGSYYYVDRPYFPLASTIAYLNLDMVGYGEQLLGQVSEAHQTLRTVMIESAAQLDIPVHVEDSGGSDHVPFEKKGVPNLMFVYWPNDVYEFYHTPADTASHTSKSNLLETSRLTALIALKLSEATVTITSATVSTTTALVGFTSASVITRASEPATKLQTTTHPSTEIETSAQAPPTTAVIGIEVAVVLGAVLVITVVAATFHYGRRRK